MIRYIEIVLEKRQVRCVARLLDDRAPKTCQAVWQALPLRGGVLHAKYASNEIFTLVPEFEQDPGRENQTVTPIPGDVIYFRLGPETRLPPEAESFRKFGHGVTDLGIFYDRNNLLLSPSEGFTPGNIFGTVVRGLENIMAAGQSVWHDGPLGERLSFQRLEGSALRQWGLE